MNSQNQRVEFIQQAIHSDDFTCEAITSDASFRRYYRVKRQTMSWILMETPVDKLDNAPFIGLNTVFAEQGLNVPQILASNEEQGLLLLQDLGAKHLADRLALPSRLEDYRALIALIPEIAKTPKSKWMKPYDAEFVDMELNIFYEWLVTKWLGLTPTEYQQVQWHNVKLKLVDAMTCQPQVTMHRDFHSRNLICHQSQWYLIDYQDAVQGPVTYDAVSLLRDCYTRLDAHEFTELQQHSFDCLKAANLLGDMDFSTYQHYFDLTGMQRHLKAAGIFTRLLQRDGKGGYLENILPTLRYLVEVANKYKEFQWLASWLENDIMPQAQAKLGTK
ncbi:aminoglycoside phosphotransferase family protein [Pseudoalteromonas maricaloris]|uniref:Phosphotransferase n=1 Tax=Pseudoalteromonas maricaloris TaxID=184924 RepID=A0A8I2H397_9GAMM|nr:phosphotransferase [Pseudoalteromonas maricaloris]NLR22331.1 phosphotransferase [Pseudoalteromonas maricaloris]WOX27939.1 phosphotransferase [Pseudoalteromonas maricaloris]